MKTYGCILKQSAKKSKSFFDGPPGNCTKLIGGHRGSGSSFKSSLRNRSKFMENTLEAFTNAYKKGANFVELDVQLTKDLVPVVYHDFSLAVQKQCENGLDSKMIEICSETYENLNQAAQNGEIQSQWLISGEAKISELNLDITKPWHIPKFSELFTELDPNINLNIEVKWPTLTVDGEYGNSFPGYLPEKIMPDHYFEMNFYVDRLLETVFEFFKGDSETERKIIFSTFDANVAEMLALKQNLVPVYYLLLPDPKFHYQELRAWSFDSAIKFAKFWNFEGINTDIVFFLDEMATESEAEELVQKFHDNNFYISCYGNHMRERKHLERARKLKLDSIIIDEDEEFKSKFL